MKIYLNGIATWEVPKYTYSDPHMGVRSISLTLEHPSNCLDESIDVPDFKDATVEYNGESFYISSAKPTGEKSTGSLNYKYTLVFNGAEEELTRRKVRNLALVGVESFISQGTSFSIYANLSQFQQLLQNNLTYYFGDEWTVNLLTTSSDEARIDINNTNIWELILKTYEYFGLRWMIVGKTINIGYTPDVIEHVFDYGKEGGLVKITRTAQSDTIINRLIGTGSSRNIPVNYFTDRYDKFPKDPNPISDTANIRTLMPKVFRDSVKTGNLPYIDYVEDASLVEANGVIEGVEEVNDEIYPSIAGVEVDGIGRIDQIIASSIPVANSVDEDGYSQVFDIWVKDIGFDLIDDKYTSTSDAKISFTSGALAGYEFTILAIGGVRQVSEDTSKSHDGVSSKYRITLIKSDEDFNATGRMLPNKVLYAESGDSFVIYDIEMPQSYVELAEERFEAWLIGRLDKRKVDNPTYAIDVMDSFFHTHANESDGKTIQEKVKVGNKIKINNTAITDGMLELHISQLTIQYGGILPKYAFTVTDNVDENRGTIEKIQSDINRVGSKQVADKQEVQSNLHTHANKAVLDLFKQDSDGNVYLEQSFYSMGGISALGLGEGGSGGTGTDLDRLDKWVDYDSTKAGWVLSALLGKDLDTRVNALQSGSATNIEISGSGNAVTGVSKSGNTLTFEKSSIFALSTQVHSHANKPILDQITQSNIDVLAKLSIVDGNIKVDTTLWATGGISALGLGSGGGSGGGGVDMLDSWANYTAVKANYYVPASLLVPFRNDTLSRLTSLESGSATSITTTGSGNAITSLTKSGSVITANKGLTFALSSHTHTIAQITGLQGALDLKATPADITTAINGIEIGGRNLLLGTSNIEIKATTNTVNTPPSEGIYIASNFSFKANQSYTISFDLKAEDGITILNYNYLLGTDGLGNIRIGDVHIIDNNEWSRYSLTVKFDVDRIGDLSLSADSRVLVVGKGLDYYGRYFKIEKGNKATDWTPSPEDQVTINTTQTITGIKTFTGNVTAPTFTGALSGNASSATNCSRSVVAGNGLTGGGALTANRTLTLGTPTTLSNATTNKVTDTSHTHAITTTTVGAVNSIVATDASGAVRGNIIRIGGAWTLELSGTELVFKYNGVIKQRMLSNGTILGTGGITALATN